MKGAALLHLRRRLPRSKRLSHRVTCAIPSIMGSPISISIELDYLGLARVTVAARTAFQSAPPHFSLFWPWDSKRTKTNGLM
jgi:hypothetical protein